MKILNLSRKFHILAVFLLLSGGCCLFAGCEKPSAEPPVSSQFPAESSLQSSSESPAEGNADPVFAVNPSGNTPSVSDSVADAPRSLPIPTLDDRDFPLAGVLEEETARGTHAASDGNASDFSGKTASDTKKLSEDDAENDAENDAFSQGEKAAEAQMSGVNPSELDKYISDDEYMFEHLKLDAPIFENAESLVRLQEDKPLWIDRERKHLVLQGWVCQTRVMLEFFLCQGTGGIRTFPYEDETGKPAKMLMFNGTKCHESVLCTEVSGQAVHAGLLALGAEPGEPVKFQPEFAAPTGEEIEVTVLWRDAEGNVVSRRGQELAVDAEGNPIPVSWVFAGSMFYNDGDGNKRYAADMEGEYIGVSNFPSVILDVAEASSSVNDALTFTANEKLLPERGTPVTVILSRKVEKK